MSTDRQQTPTDLELVTRTRRGDEGAFVALYRRHQGGLYRFAVRMAASEAIAADALQETFLALLAQGDGFDPARGSVTSYLFGILRKQLARRMGRDTVAEEDAGDDVADESSLDALESMGRAERIQAVRDAIAALTPPLREVIALCALEGMSYEDAAAALQIPVGTVRSRLSRARARLCALLQNHDTGTLKEARS